MNKIKFTKEKLCAILMMGYHLLFLGGASTMGNHYLEEYRKAEKVLIEQMNRAEKMVDTAKKTIDNAGSSVRTIEKELKKVRKSCEKFLWNL